MKKRLMALFISLCFAVSSCASLQTEQDTSSDTEAEAVFTYPYETDTLVEEIVLKEYVFTGEIVDYSEKHGISFTCEEQKNVYNLACIFIYGGLGINTTERYGSFTIEGRKLSGWLTGYTYESYLKFCKSIFCGKIPNTQLLEYSCTGELFMNDAWKGGSSYTYTYETLYEDEKTFIIRNTAVSTDDPSEYGYYFTILVMTDEGWKVSVLEHPNL
ncbi:MAG: hypothetical protein IJ416_08980 [Ruminiclostridium sp.]|nr:hypothetical protein [Ruminiclostridium sp.]